MSSLDFAVDHARATVTVISLWPAEPQRLWEIWADPRRLERWWGPPMYPATVFAHDFSEGGIVSYYMTSPEGEKFSGGWRILKIQAPRLLEFEDYFADEDGNENPNLPRSRTTVAIEARSNAPTQMTMTTRYSSDEELRQVLEMSMQEGLTLAMGQIDALLIDSPSHSDNRTALRAPGGDRA